MCFVTGEKKYRTKIFHVLPSTDKNKIIYCFGNHDLRNAIRFRQYVITFYGCAINDIKLGKIDHPQPYSSISFITCFILILQHLYFSLSSISIHNLHNVSVSLHLVFCFILFTISSFRLLPAFMLAILIQSIVGAHVRIMKLIDFNRYETFLSG